MKYKNTSLMISLLAIGLVGCNSATSDTADNITPADTATPTETVMENDDAMMDGEEASEGAVMEDGAYKDGTYEAVGNYTSPGGEEEVGVTITLENGVVVDSSVEVLAERDASVKWQTAFSENYAEMVTGKSIDEVDIDKAGGSSLTPIGFMDALEKIKMEAKG